MSYNARFDDNRLLSERQCGDKRRFLDYATADTIRREFEHQHKCKMDAYKCPWCGFWHIGHEPNGRCSQDVRIEEIDDTMTPEEVDAERTALVKALSECQLKRLNKLDYHDYANQRVFQISTQARLAMLNNLRKEHKRKREAALQKAKGAQQEQHKNKQTEELLEEFFGVAKEIAARLRVLESRNLQAEAGMKEG